MKSIHQAATSLLWCHALRRKTWSMLMYVAAWLQVLLPQMHPYSQPSFLILFFLNNTLFPKPSTYSKTSLWEKIQKGKALMQLTYLLWKSIALRVKYKMLLSDCSFLTWTNVPVRKIQSEINRHSLREQPINKLPVIVIANTKQAETMPWGNHLTCVYISIL